MSRSALLMVVGFSWLFVARLQAAEVSFVELTVNSEVRSAAFSPNGKQVVAGGGFPDGFVRIWTLK